MTLDEIDDYKFFSELYSLFPSDSIIDVLDAYRVLERNPKLASINSMVKQKDLDDSSKKRISEFYKTNKDKILKVKRKIYSEYL